MDEPLLASALAPPFTFPVEAEALFAERAEQVEAWGVPRRLVREVGSRIQHVWVDEPGGWAFEWTKAAQDAERDRQWLIASACYGAARFPCAATPLRERAQERQIDAFRLAVPSFKGHFERRTLHVPYRDGVTKVVVHVYEPHLTRDLASRRWPIVVLSGGVDTFKVELHRLAAAVCRFGRFTVVAMDMPGTGESEIALAPDADTVYAGVLDVFRQARGAFAPTAVLGLSFGGHWAAKVALLGGADACVDVGGPVGAVALDGEFLARLPDGMTGIVANALRLGGLPTAAQASSLFQGFRLDGLIRAPRPTRLLVVNGADDPYLAPEDTTAFEAVETATVWRVAGAGHCAAGRFQRVVPAIVGWLRVALHGDTVRNRLFAAATRRALPRLA